MTVESLLFVIPVLPFLGFLLNGLLGRRLPRPVVAVIACAGPAVAFAIAVLGVLSLAGHEDADHRLSQNLGTWIAAGDLSIPFAFSLDRLGAVMCLVVTGVGTLIHIYSTGYMKDDPGYAKFFAYLNLFMAAMLVLVLADNIALLFLGWEGVGLCSYLLIGFWYKDLGNCNAGIKAFVVNRIGDLAFLLGIFLIYVTFGTFQFHGEAGINAQAAGADASPVFFIALLLFIGATGKSAQIPLYVWLPDAMAGPTPVSALIHAATMVTSGVYMVARLGPLYSLAPEVGTIIAVVGTLTALLAACIAFSQRDIKKVLAYSTVSQLGYMFVAAGVGAYAIAIFHVVTHAFFKGLLFLGAGAVIHSLHHEQDMRRMGGLKGRIPQTYWLFLIGALALAGFPLTAGFFSKDEILHVVHERGGGLLTVLWIVGLVTAVFTAFYTFRQVVLVFFGNYRGAEPEPEGGHDHGHGHGPPKYEDIQESPWSMRAPLYVLAVLSAGGGFLAVPHFLGFHEPEGTSKLGGWILGGILSLVGIGAALGAFLKAPTLVKALVDVNPVGRMLAQLSRGKFYVDELYDRLVVKPVYFLAEFLFYVLDRLLIDMILVHGSAMAVRIVAAAVRRVQTGRVPTYAMWFLGGALGVLALTLWLAERWS